MTAKINRTGHRYGRLTVLCEAESKVHPSGNVSIHWYCRCDCGVEKAVSGKALATGLTVSCGCKSADTARLRWTTHGMSESEEYGVWLGMLDRCHNKNCKAYNNYGGRGVVVCDEWRGDFAAFFAHIGPRPSPDHSVDRIRNNEGYAPGNVRWATWIEQANNRRARKLAKACGRGHLLTPDSVYIQKKTGNRFCKACRDIREARRVRCRKKKVEIKHAS